MSKLISKARSGVTLVELLVVILIVTILSVSMLPLLQPFVVEAQYAAEPIPVIGNLRTKVGLYQYDKGKLPQLLAQKAGEDGTIAENEPFAPAIETWVATTSADNTTSIGDAATSDSFAPAYAMFGDETAIKPTESLRIFDAGDFVGDNKHIGTLCDIDYQELKGKRSKPVHYQYLTMRNGTAYAYFLGCFGDGNGLKAGTGYAVCEIVSGGHKYVGTWKRYKAVDSSGDQICFTSNPDLPEGDTDTRHTLGCYVPGQDSFNGDDMNDDGTGQLPIVNTMTTYGWEF